MSPAAERRAPEAFRLDEPGAAEIEEDILADLDPVEEDAERAVSTIVEPKKRGIRWGRIAAAGGGGLLSLAVGIAVDDLIRSLFQRADWLGWLGLGLLALFLTALLAIVGRELIALARLKAVARLRLAADAAYAANDREKARRVAQDLVRQYQGRPDTAQGRRQLKQNLGAVMDGADLIRLAERDLVLPLDRRAKAAISSAARRVSVVTAVSPRALIDVAYVLVACLGLIRKIATIYGGRPGFFGLVRLTGAVVSHLAVTGTIAIGDTLLQQVVGHGLAARLSARFGEGVVNGLMTARIGLSALDVCRPVPFVAQARPRLKDIAGDLVSFSTGRRDTVTPATQNGARVNE
ncbi:YcjF family protein [Afifella sp. IM 167]|uniref:YcjF family protein n=1 Tax=Afifella sp. IM 167 TaxID=2033586 RepID=UPI001CCEA67F|nr:TIGR01620 family protein [Afifella sp. IM 167]MBZ8134727.1 TIGR01620 family protein [Afifella sp. IM 167]